VCGYLFASAKLDGVRALSTHEGVLSRSLKPIRNRWLQDQFLYRQEPCFGYDGELIVGDPTAKDCYRKTMSQVMSFEGEPDFTFWVFDRWDLADLSTSQRLGRLEVEASSRVKVLPQTIIHSVDELLAYEAENVRLGFEGTIIARPDMPYKYGRSTVREGGKCKLKRFTDSEMVVTGYYELRRNMNESVENELGYGARSSHKENMVAGDTLGGLIGTDLVTGIEVRLGTGFTAGERDIIWRHREAEIGRIWKYKHFEHGAKDKARHPVALGRRDPLDLLS
jgi:DNA ligase-1